MQLSGLTTAAGLAAAAGAEDPEAAAIPILPNPVELVFGLVVFLIFLAVIAKYVVPNLEKAYAERKAAIEGGMSQAEEAQREAEATKRRYEQQLADARDEAARIREEAREQGASIIAEMRGQAQAEAARITEGAQKQIRAEHAQALTSLRSEVGRLSTDLASRIVGESLHNETRRSGIVDRFLEELEAGRVRPEAVGHGTPTPAAHVGAEGQH
ncbi:F0F1 ATP synthase subunit B [Agilicoccus flavus]|uniref:F0F1 ATP synthase subunit B n=1 Tax=Agilicoccus flavus TaxID=2775968 RepID=UPI001CF63D85|nr:F0F1 ATP synthase subunit B [Agilicoccus flavus]